MDAPSISDGRSSRHGAAALAIALALVLAIALLQRWGVLTPVNHGLMGAAGTGRDTGVGAAVTPVMQAASIVGGTAGRMLLLAVATVALIVAKRGRACLWLVAVVLGGTLLNLALKQIFAAPRPDLLPHLDIVHTYSFPSGHAAGNLIFFGAAALLARCRAGWAVAIACIGIIGVSRIWLGVHWPSDVAAGWIEGIGWLAFCASWLPPLDSDGHHPYPADGIGKGGGRRA